MAYLVGAVFIVNTIFGISSYLIFFVIIIPAITFLILGVRPSSKYAVYTGVDDEDCPDQICHRIKGGVK